MDRVSFLMNVKKGYEDEYIRRHLNVWPEVMAEHERAGVRKMAIFMKDSELFLYMEVDDYPKAVRILSASPEVLRWEEYMAPIMEETGTNGFDPANAYPSSLPEVFYWAPASSVGEAAKSASETVDAPPIGPPHIHMPRKSPLSK